jgi:hypothetical protein
MPRHPEPTAGLVLSEEPWAFDARPGVILRTRHYRIFTTLADTELRGLLPVFLEAAMIRYTTAVAPLPPPEVKLDTFVMSDREQWATLAKMLLADEARVYLRIEEGGFAQGGRALYHDIGDRDTLAMAAHEGWHQFVQRTFRQPLPVWMGEAMATHMEGFSWRAGDALPRFDPRRNPQRRRELARVVRAGELMPLSELLETAPQDTLAPSNAEALAYYAQVWALGLFLLDAEAGAHRQAVQEMLADARDGRLLVAMERVVGPVAAQRALRRRRGHEAFITYLGTTPDALNHAYRRYATDLARDTDAP